MHKYEQSLAVGFSLLMAVGAISVESPALAAGCLQSGKIQVSDLSDGVKVCPGGVVELSLSGLPAALPLPTPGTAVGYVLDPETGHASLTFAVDSDGTVNSALDGFPLSGFVAHDAAGVSLLGAATYPGCSSTAYSLLGHKWTVPWVWRYNSMNQTDSTVLSAIQEAANLWTVGANRCTGQIYTSSFVNTYAGTTALGQAAASDGNCYTYDGVNVVGWGNTPSGVLAETCIKTSQGRAIEADIRISTGALFYTGSSGAGCSSKFDLRQIFAHEVGHVVGLNHVMASTNQLMKPTFGYCETGQRLLAPGDIAGLKVNY